MLDFRKWAVALICLGAVSLGSTAAHAQAGEADAALVRTITSLDAEVFSAYNRCDLAAFEGYFSPTVEFYHDQGGATFDRKTVVENTRKNICGKVQRRLLTSSFKVYPIKDFGAVEEGEHIFCELAIGRCEGVAKFLMIWEQKDDKWRMTRVVSFGHRALRPGELPAEAPPKP